MRLAIFSDVHANLEALEAVVHRATSLGVDRFVCLGDVVGYGADPGACIDRIRALDPFTVIRGNHDEMVGTGRVDPFTTRRAVVAVEWTRQALSADQLAWLRELPLSAQLDDAITFVHDSPVDPGAWNYISSQTDADRALEALSTPLCFFGHTHQPIAVQSDVGRIPFSATDPVLIDPDARYLMNVGSVGQPRDGDPRASFGLYDQEKGCVELYRVNYEVALTQSKILAAELPATLAERLGYGR